MLPVLRSARRPDRSAEPPFCHADLTLGLMDRADEVITVGTDVRLGERGHSGSVLLDVVSDRCEFVGGGLSRSGHVARRYRPNDVQN